MSTALRIQAQRRERARERTSPCGAAQAARRGLARVQGLGQGRRGDLQLLIDLHTQLRKLHNRLALKHTGHIRTHGGVQANRRAACRGAVAAAPALSLPRLMVLAQTA